jgi:hypothetical protein
LERGTERAEMRELGAGGEVQKLDRARQFQERRRGERKTVGEREDGADGAGVRSVLIVFVARWLLPLRGFGGRCLRGKGRDIGQPALNGRRRLCDGSPVKMPARQHQLDRKRKQRQPRAVLEVFSEPVHEAYALSFSRLRGASRCYIITSRKPAECQSSSECCPGCGARKSSGVGFVQHRVLEPPLL